VFAELMGFRDLPLFEDYEFARRLESRFESKPIRTLALWTLLQTAYSLGASAERLARYYSAVR
jgi:hypothetical protein